MTNTKELSDLEKIMLFTEEYKVELLKISPKNLEAREQSMYLLLREDDLYSINTARAKFIVKNLIPKLKEQFAEHHQKSEGFIKAIDPRIKKITENPAYQIVLRKINPTDAKIFQKYITDKHSLDQEKLKYMITKILPVMLSSMQKLSSKEEKVIRINELVKEKGKQITAKLSNKEYSIYNQIKNGEIKLLTEEEIEIIYNKLINIPTASIIDYSPKINSFKAKYKDKINDILHLLPPEDSLIINRVLSLDLEEIDQKQLEYTVNTIIPKVLNLLEQKKKEENDEIKKLNSYIKSFIKKNIDDITEIIFLLSKDKQNLLNNYVNYSIENLDSNIDIKDLKTLKEQIIPEITSLIESTLNNPNSESKETYIKKIMEFKIKYNYELNNITFKKSLYQSLLLKIKSGTFGLLSLSELKIICDSMLPPMEKWAKKSADERKDSYNEILKKYTELIDEEYYLKVYRSLKDADKELIDKINTKLNQITTYEMKEIKRILKDMKMRIDNFKERDIYINKIKELINKNRDKKFNLGKIEQETFERIYNNPKVLIKEEVKRLYEALYPILNPVKEEPKIEKTQDKKEKIRKRKISIIQFGETKGYSKEIVLKAISYLSEHEIRILQIKFGQNYDEYNNDELLTNGEVNYLNSRVRKKVIEYCELIKNNTPEETILKIEEQSHKRGCSKFGEPRLKNRMCKTKKNVKNLSNAESIYEIKRFVIYKHETVDEALRILNNQKLNAILDKRFNKKEELSQEERSYLISYGFIILQNKCSEIEPNPIIIENIPEKKNKKAKIRNRRKLNEIAPLKGIKEEIIEEASKKLTAEELEILNKHKNGEEFDKNQRLYLYGSILPKLKTLCEEIDPPVKKYIKINHQTLKSLIPKLSEKDQLFYNNNYLRKISELNNEELEYIDNILIPNLNNIAEEQLSKGKTLSSINKDLLKKGYNEEIIKQGLEYLLDKERDLLIKRYGSDLNSVKWTIELSENEKAKLMYHVKLATTKLLKICEQIKAGKNAEEIKSFANKKEVRKLKKRTNIYEILKDYPKIVVRIGMIALNPDSRNLLEEYEFGVLKRKDNKGRIYYARRAIRKSVEEIIALISAKPDLTDYLSKDIIDNLYNDINNPVLDNLDDQTIENIYFALKHSSAKSLRNSIHNQRELHKFTHLERFDKNLINDVIKNNLPEADQNVINKYLNNEPLTDSDRMRLYNTIIFKIETACQRQDPTNVYPYQKLSKLINPDMYKYKLLSETEKELVMKYKDTIIIEIPRQDKNILINSIAIKIEKQKPKNSKTIYSYYEKYGINKEVVDEALKHLNKEYLKLIHNAYGKNLDQEKVLPNDNKEEKRLANAIRRLKVLCERIKNGEPVEQYSEKKIPHKTRKKIQELVGANDKEMQLIIDELSEEERLFIIKNDNNESLLDQEQSYKNNLVAHLKTILKKIRKVSSAKKIVKVEDFKINDIKYLLASIDLKELICQIIKSNNIEEKRILLENKIFILLDQKIVNILKDSKTNKEILAFMLVTNKVPEMELTINEISVLLSISIEYIKEIVHDCMNILIEKQESLLEEQNISLNKKNES